MVVTKADPKRELVWFALEPIEHREHNPQHAGSDRAAGVGAQQSRRAARRVLQQRAALARALVQQRLCGTTHASQAPPTAAPGLATLTILTVQTGNQLIDLVRVQVEHYLLGYACQVT